MPIRVINPTASARTWFDPRNARTDALRANAGPENAVSAIMSILSGLNSYALQWRVKNEFTNLKPNLDQEITSWADNNPTGVCYDPSNVGVLVHIIVYSQPAPLGMAPTMGFIGMYSGDCALDYKTALINYVNQGVITPSSPPDATTSWFFWWYTLDSPSPI